MFGPAGARRVPASLLLLTLVLFGVAGWCIWSRATSPTDGATVSPADSQVAFALLWGTVLHFAIAFPVNTMTRRQCWQVAAGYVGPRVERREWTVRDVGQPCPTTRSVH